MLHQVVETFAYLSGKLNAALDNLVPSSFVHGIEVLVAYIMFQQPEDDACVEIISCTDGTDRPTTLLMEYSFFRGFKSLYVNLCAIKSHLLAPAVH